MSRLRLMLSEMMYILKRRTNPNQAATIPLNGRRPMPTPMKILAVVRKARVDGIDIESALRNRLRDVEEKVALIESEINND